MSRIYVRAYGIGRIGGQDNLVVRRIVAPKFDEHGSMIPLRPARDVGIRHGSWRERCGL